MWESSSCCVNRGLNKVSKTHHCCAALASGKMQFWLQFQLSQPLLKTAPLVESCSGPRLLCAATIVRYWLLLCYEVKREKQLIPLFCLWLLSLSLPECQMLWKQFKPESWVRKVGIFSTWSKHLVSLSELYILETWKRHKEIKFYLLFNVYGEEVRMCNSWRCIVLLYLRSQGFDFCG